MEFLMDKAARYAAENKDKILQALITKVYTEGYWDGYNDHKNDVEMSRQDDKIHYVDLGLPSKTLWADKFVESGGLIKYIPYCDAELLSLPTSKQWRELQEECRWVYKDKVFYCVGPNGRYITFNKTGYKELNDCSTTISEEKVYLWIKRINSNNVGWIDFYGKVNVNKAELFTGYKLPIRLVKNGVL